MKGKVKTDATMNEVMAVLLGNGSLMVKPENGNEFEIRSGLGDKTNISITRTNTNSERRVSIPIHIPSIDGTGTATFDYTIEHDGTGFKKPVGGLVIAIT